MENSSHSEKPASEPAESAELTGKFPRKDYPRKSYPRKPSPIPEHQLEKDRQLSRKLYRVIYALPFLVVALAFFLYLVTQ